MKNLAIIVGVADYVDQNYRLPGCINDVEIMQIILRSSGNFEVHNIESNDGEIFKNQLSDTIRRYSHEEIDHLLFYFTGHGSYLNDDFHFLLRDYSTLRSAQTSLASKDLDRMLRSLQPKLTVKVIDACYSGLNYVKSDTTVQQELGEGMRTTFTNCHFLFSSESDQRSYADHEMSDFTAAFARSIVEAKTPDVRYRYVIDSITDAFSNQDRQTPYFVSQGPCTEILGTFDETTKCRIALLLPKINAGKHTPIDLPTDSEFIAEISPTVEGTPANETRSLAMIAKRASSSFMTQEQGTLLVQSIRDGLDQCSQNDELEELYSLEKEFFHSYPDLPNERSIGSWLERNKSGEYFAEPIYRTELYDVPPSLTGSSIDLMMAQLNIPAKKTRKVLTGITSSLQGMPFQAFCLTLNPKLPNLILYRLWLTFLISKKTLQVFHTFVAYQEVSWGKFEEGESVSWTRSAFGPHDLEAIERLPPEILSMFDLWVIDQIKKRLAVA